MTGIVGPAFASVAIALLLGSLPCWAAQEQSAPPAARDARAGRTLAVLAQLANENDRERQLAGVFARSEITGAVPKLSSTILNHPGLNY